MASRKIKRERFALLDEIGFGMLCKFYIEGGSVKDLCRFLFDWSKHGKPGVNLLYRWIAVRGHRPAWEYTVRFKRKLHEEALGKVELQVPEIDWDRWEEECALALGTPRKGSETDEED
jgi:hypothetical protein